ncbi:MAG: hypothetical protein RL497_2767 [Pseudomonadota bacterium]
MAKISATPEIQPDLLGWLQVQIGLTRSALFEIFKLCNP